MLRAVQTLESPHHLSIAEQVRDEDTRLVELARSGESDAVSELYRRHERRVYNLALRTLGNPWDAADVAQETFIKAFRNLDSFKGEARFGTWLHRIAVNAAYDYLRRHRPEPMESEILDNLSGPAGPASVVGSGRGGVDPAVDGLSEPLSCAISSDFHMPRPPRSSECKKAPSNPASSEPGRPLPRPWWRPATTLLALASWRQGTPMAWIPSQGRA
jgi:RNA polymerase sigma factor (sigma-70 family)